MDTALDDIRLAVDGERLAGTVLTPARRLPGVLFVHGWGGSRLHDLVRAREVAGLGCVCLTFDLRGHEHTVAQRETVTREQNLRDLLAAYDWLAARPDVDPEAIAVVGLSYGGYLAALMTAMRPVRWLALRSPAIYPDEGWSLPKRALHSEFDIMAYRARVLRPQDNRALAACERYRGEALVVAAENDVIVPRAVTDSYVAAFRHVRSLTVRTLMGADHALSEKPAQKAYTRLLVRWLTEMVMGARQDVAKARVVEHKTRSKAAAG